MITKKNQFKLFSKNCQPEIYGSVRGSHVSLILFRKSVVLKVNKYLVLASICTLAIFILKMTLENKSENEKHTKYQVVSGTGSGYTSKLIACQSFKKDDILETITGATFALKRYTTVQINEHEHIELNSDIVYLNHSCDPTCTIDVKNMLVRVIKDVPSGGELTFFYPSTEWEMDQPFKCWCKSPRCIGTVKGAKFLSKDVLDKYFINEHILKLAKKNDN